MMGFLKRKKLEKVNQEIAEVKQEIVKEQEVPPIVSPEAEEIEVYEPEEEVKVEETIQEEVPMQAPPVKESVKELREKIRIAEEELAVEQEEKQQEEEESVIAQEPIEPELTEEIVKETLFNHEQRLRNIESSFFRLKNI